MVTYRVITHRTSGWYTVVLPTTIFLIVWGLLAFGIPTLFRWRIPDWGGYCSGLVVFSSQAWWR